MSLTTDLSPLSSLESLFEQASRQSVIVGRLALLPLAQGLSAALEGEDRTIGQWAEALYWLSCLIVWKGQWILLQRTSRSQALSAKEKKVRSRIVAKSTQGVPSQKLRFLVTYLEHKTFESLSLEREQRVTHEILSLSQLKKLYSNLQREKRKKSDLAHIGLREGGVSQALPENWAQVLPTFSEDQAIDSYLSTLNRGEKVAVFQDLLFRQKKGEIFLSQAGTHAPIFVKYLESSVVSYG